MHGEFCESLCKVFVNSSIIIQLLILCFLLSLDSTHQPNVKKKKKKNKS